MNKVGLVFDDRYLEHDTGDDHPERPERLVAIRQQLNVDGLIERLVAIAPGAATDEQLLAVHSRSMIDRVAAASARLPQYLDADTRVSRKSYDTALLAAGGLIEACDAVMQSTVHHAFCAVRPPGHHAESDRSMGFCLFNNVAVAARHLQRTHGVRNVAIVDWDVHHGNGTQQIFYDDPTVLYVSLHQHPLYPGTGLRSERGSGEGIGTTLNIPLPAGSDDGTYAAAFAEVETAVRQFNPGFILVSAGYDAHIRDPLASMAMTARGYAELTERVMTLARDLCDGRLVLALEGGYDLHALSECVSATLTQLVG